MSRKKEPRGQCVIEGCGRDAFYKEAQLCQRCYSALYYWRKKSVTEIVSRKNKLKLFMRRMDVVEPNVVAMPHKRRASR